jgi:hypothetical protein
MQSIVQAKEKSLLKMDILSDKKKAERSMNQSSEKRTPFWPKNKGYAFP